MPTEHRILSVFERELRPGEEHAESVLGEKIDALLGFSSSRAEAVPGTATGHPVGNANSWRDAPASYGSLAEQRLQTLCDVCLTHLRSRFAVAKSLHIDDICVRIVTGRYSSPFTQSINGYHYIVLSAGYLKSLENLFRTQEHLASLGAALRSGHVNVGPESERRVHSNTIGGADAEHALRAGTPAVNAALGSVFNDVIFWAVGHGPYSYPEDTLAAMARAAYEMLVGGMYSSDGKSDVTFRPPPTRRSMVLTRLVMAYVLCHELTHIVLRADGDAPVGDPFTETLCDQIATEYSPLFVQDAGPAWDVHLNGGIEHIAGQFGFFMAAEVIEKTALFTGLHGGRLKEGDAAYDRVAQRIDDVEQRRNQQLKLLRNVLDKEPDMLRMLDLALTEFSVLPIAVEMTGVKLLKHRISRFHSHFDRRFGQSM